MYASLSRAQIEFGGPATFGLEVSRASHKYNADGNGKAKKGSSFQLGSMIERGAFNYRWPLTEYYLDLYEEAGASNDQSKQTHVGTCQMFSYTKGGIFYQVLRVEEGSDSGGNNASWHPFPAQSQIVLTIGGPVWFHTFKAEDRLHDHDLTKKTNMDKVLDMNEDPSLPPGTKRDPLTANKIRFWDETRKIGLEANVYQYQPGEAELYKRLPLTQSEAAADNGPDEVQGEYRVRAYNAVVPFPHLPNQDHGQKEHRRATFTFVAAIRLFEGDANSQPDWDPTLPTSEEMHKHIGVDPSSDNATGAMWDTIFIERRDKSDSVLDLAEVHLVGRTLEKILQVAVIPTPFYQGGETTAQGGETTAQGGETTAQGGETTALVSNLFIRPNVDLKAML
jgi:hypothetical protein